uniref:Uncharacterized protein n=1 Tax=Alongshan virus TaxID=2269360 RepID=A0A6B9SDV2_9FLAV|nr:hypothetical protein [Alongshan virus]
MASKTISDTINNAADQVQGLFRKLMGSNSFNAVPLIVLGVAWFITGDLYIIAFSAIAALGPATRAEAALLPLIVAVIIRKSNRTISRAALALAAACYIGIMPALALDQGDRHNQTEGTIVDEGVVGHLLHCA